jgi:hypothetical protein
MEVGFLVHAATPVSDALRARRERAMGLPHDELVARLAQISAFGLDAADAARPLLRQLA